MSEHERNLRRRVVAGKFTAIARQQRERFVIEFNVKPWRPGHRYVWPILFKTHELAQAFVDIVPAFINMEATADRGRLSSLSIEKRMLPERANPL